MPLDPLILGSTVSISGAQSAEDALAARAAEAQEQAVPSQAAREAMTSEQFGNYLDATYGPVQQQNLGTPLITPGEMQDVWTAQASAAAKGFAAPQSGYMGSLAGYETAPSQYAAPPKPFDYGPKLTFGTTGTPFQGSRYAGEPGIPYPSQANLPPVLTSPPAEDRWAAKGDNGRVDSGFDPWQGPPPGVGGVAGIAGGFGPEPDAYTAYDRLRDIAQPVAERFRGYAAQGLARISDATAGSPLSVLAGRGVEALGGLPSGTMAAEETEAGSPGFLSRWGKNLAGHAGYALAYGLQQLGEDAGRLYGVDNDGRYYTPEQRTTAAAGVLPGVAGLVGTVAGAAFGNPILGGGIGAAIGSAAQGVIGADDERNQALRETSERLSSALGAAADSTDRFKTLLEQTGAPIAQVGEGLKTLQGLGPGVGADAITGAGRMALAEGERYQEDTAGVGRFLSSDPALYGLKSRFATSGGDLSADAYRGIAGLALSRGDMDAYNAAQDSASAARYAADPAYNALARNAQSDGDTWSNQFNHAATGFLSHFGVHMEDEDPIALDAKAMDTRRKQIDATQAATDADDLKRSLALGKARFDLGESQTQASISGSAFDLARLRGGSAADLSDLLPGIEDSFGDARAADRAFIGDARTAIKGLNPKDPAQAALIQGYRSDILRYTQDEAEYPLKQAALEKSVFDQGLQETEARYNYSETKERYSGRSAASMLPGYRRIAGYLESEADDQSNPLSPSERYGLRSQSLQTVYAAQQDAFSQNLDTNSLGYGQAQTRVTQAQIGGGAEEVYKAQMDAVGVLKDRLTELTQQFHTAGQAASDYTREQTQAAQVQQQIAQAAFSADQDRWNGRIGTNAALGASASVGLSRDIRLGGNAAFGGDILSYDTDAMTLSQSKLDSDRHLYPGNTGLLANDTLAASQSREGYLSHLEQQHSWSPDAATQEADMTATGQYRRSLLEPYTDGGGDPFSRASGVIDVLGREESSLTANFHRSLAADGRIADPRMRRQATDADTLDYTRQHEALLDEQAQYRHDLREAENVGIAEMAAGSPGGGVGAVLVTNAARAALYDPNARNGSWMGLPPQGTHTMGGVASVSPYGKGIDPSNLIPMSGPAAAGNGEEARVLMLILQELQRQGRGGTRMGGPQAPRDAVGAVSHALGFNYNPNQGH